MLGRRRLEDRDPLLLSLWCVYDVLFVESLVGLLWHVFNVLFAIAVFGVSLECM